MGQATHTIRKTLKWCAVLVLLLAASAAGYGYTVWQRSNEILRQAFVDRVKEIAPEWDFHVDSAGLDRLRRIHVYNMQVFAGSQTPAIITLPEIIVTVDVDAFIERQAVVVEKITLLGPEVHLRRTASGAWNWQQLAPPKKTDRSLPEFDIQKGTLKVYLEQPDGSSYSRIVADRADLKFVPSAKRQFVFSGRTQVEQAGTLAIDGTWNVDAKAFACNGRMQDVTVGEDLLEVAAGSSQKFREALAGLQRRLSAERTALESAPTQTAFNDSTQNAGSAATTAAAPVAEAPPEPPQLGVAGTVDVEFLFSRLQANVPPDFQMKVNLREGQIANALLPFPLYDLAGKVEWNNERVTLKEFSAKNGNMRVDLAAEMTSREKTAGIVAVRLRDLVLDERLRRRLPEGYRKVYDQLSPTGQVDVAIDFEKAGDGRWQQRNFVLAAKRCSCAHAKFPYRIVEVNGTMSRAGQDLNLSFEGLAGQRPIACAGVVRNLGPEAETTIDLRVDHLPLDETFRSACPPGALRAIETLGLRGQANIGLRLYRPPGPGQRLQWSLESQVIDAQVVVEQFPYRMEQVGGAVRYSSADDVWRFDNVTAQHGPATRVVAAGQFTRGGERPGLRLSVALRHAELDGLQTALRLHIGKALDDLSPTGKLHADAIIDYSPGRQPVVTITKAELFDGTLVPRAFPYPLQNVRATFNYLTPGHVEIGPFTAKHEQTSLAGKAVFNFSPTGWELKFDNLSAESVVADEQLRAALPPDMRGVVDRLNPRGPLSIAGTLYFRGTDNHEDRVAATWDIQTKLASNALALGVDVNNASGWVTTNGTMDHLGIIRMQGMLNLDSVYVKQYQLTQVHGPFQLENRVLTLGSRDALLPLNGGEKQPQIPLEKRVTARAIDGLVTLDAQVQLEEQPKYHALLTISKEELEKFARRYMASSGNIRGTVNGWIDLHGTGVSAQNVTGRGQVQISPAALYKLPVIAQILDFLRFAPPDDTAFRYAFAEFEVGRGQFQFKRIDLNGEAVSLTGYGTAQFDPPTGRLDLEFAARLPRNQLAAQIPLVNILADEAARALVGVRVTGTTQAPNAQQMQTPPILAEAMRGLQNLLEGRPGGNFPLLAIPTLGPVPPQQLPQTYRQPRREYRR